MSEVWVNQEKAGERLWPPYEFDITEYVVEGENKLKVKVGNTVYNVMRYYYDNQILHNTDFVTRRFPGPGEIRSGMFGPVEIRISED